MKKLKAFPRYYWVLSSDTTNVDCMDMKNVVSSKKITLPCSNHFGNTTGWRIIGVSGDTPCWKCDNDNINTSCTAVSASPTSSCTS